MLESACLWVVGKFILLRKDRYGSLHGIHASACKQADMVQLSAADTLC